MGICNYIVLADGRMELDVALMASFLDGNISSCCHSNFSHHLSSHN
jgi:hypothetical protein